jgi:chromosome segregation ATPase
LSNIAAKVVDLRQQVDTTRRLRSDAEAHLAIGKSRLQQIDSRLREIGINPENVDAELQELESQFETQISKHKQELTQEAERYNEIINKTKQSIGEAK